MEPLNEEKQTNMDSSMCASSDQAPDWNQINWRKSERQIRRLQARIVNNPKFRDSQKNQLALNFDFAQSPVGMRWKLFTLPNNISKRTDAYLLQN